MALHASSRSPDNQPAESEAAGVPGSHDLMPARAVKGRGGRWRGARGCGGRCLPRPRLACSMSARVSMGVAEVEVRYADLSERRRSQPGVCPRRGAARPGVPLMAYGGRCRYCWPRRSAPRDRRLVGLDVRVRWFFAPYRLLRAARLLPRVLSARRLAADARRGAPGGRQGTHRSAVGNGGDAAAARGCLRKSILISCACTRVASRALSAQAVVWPSGQPHRPG